MATRLHLPSSSFSSITTAFSPSWEETGSAIRSNCFPYKTDTAGVGRAVTHSVASIGDVLVVQYISEPLDGYQFISGTFKGAINCFETVATNDCRAQLVIKVVSNDGSITRGVLLAENNSGLFNEFGTTYSLRRFPLNYASPGVTLSPLGAQDQDRIVIEVGVRFHTATTSTVATLAFQDLISNGDVGETEGVLSAVNPWMEFSQDIVFYRTPNVSATYNDGYSGLPEIRFRDGYIGMNYSDGYSGLPSIQIQGNLANLCGTQDSSAVYYYVMRGTDVDCAGPDPTYRTWTVSGDPDPTGFYYFGVKCGPSLLTDIIIVKELVI